jgi:protein ImuB
LLVESSHSFSTTLVLPARSAKDIEGAKETERILAILHQWGIHTVGQLGKLNRDDLAVRLGARAIELWERANGHGKGMLRLVSPPESFIESFEFENEIETSEPLLFMLRRFLQQLATRLNAIYLVAKELRLRITFSGKSHYERLFKIPQPTNNEEILFRMLYTHLENFTSKHPIVAVALEAQPSKPVRQQFGLFETALRDPAQLHETLARLVGLLGANRVGCPVLEETHRPDAFRMEPFVWEFGHSDRGLCHVERSRGVPLRNGKVTPRDSSTPLRSAQDDRVAAKPPVLRRFRKRVKATVFLENNQPAHVRSAETEGVTVANDGPFPLSGNWWDEKAWAQVEWDMELENGVVARCHWDKEGWAVDGIYD